MLCEGSSPGAFSTATIKTRPCREDLLLQVAVQLEEIFEWGGRCPELLAADDTAAAGNGPTS